MIIDIRPILSGFEVGAPIHLLTLISHNINNYNIANINLNNQIILNYLLTYSCYKIDRYSDYQEYSLNLYNNTNLINYDKSKIKLFESFSNNEKNIKFSLFVTYISILYILLYTKQTYYIPLLLSTFNYKDLKKNLSYYKSIYLSTIWALTCTILPFIPYIDLNQLLTHNSFLPVFFNIFATTNIADFKDINEDKANNIKTLPIIMGKNKSIKLIILSSLLSIIFLINNPNFEINILNNIFIASNIFPLFYFTNYTK